MNKYKVGDILVGKGFLDYYRIVEVYNVGEVDNDYIIAFRLPESASGGWGKYSESVYEEYRRATLLEVFLLGVK